MIRVLLADDEIETRDNIVQCIDWSRNGLDLVGSASDGEMAFQMIQTLHPDIAILDIYMPRLNGIQVIERCHAQMKDPPAFIIISGYDDFSCAQQAIRLKVEEYLLKPFRPEDLMGAIQRALLQIELKRNGKKSDFITFVLACQKETHQYSEGHYSMDEERHVLTAISAGASEDVVRCVDNFLRVCVLDMPVSIALRHSEMLYFEICRLMLERTGKFPEENVFFNRTWSKDNVFQQLQEVLHEAASDAQVLINAGKRRSSVIIAAVNYVEQHYTENISLKQMAEDIFVSPPYLSNLFKEKMGVNVTAYIHEVRIEKSKKLLLDSTWSIQQIAEQVGYRSEKHFMQMFKKICGMTPSQFRFKKTQ